MNDMTRQSKIPVYGSMTRPGNPDEGLSELKNSIIEWKNGDILITYETDEFTSLCPKTGQPDFNIVRVSYVPTDKYIESKSMKFYLWSFREFGMHCEHLADRIAHDIKEATNAKFVRVECSQKARGGLKLQAVKQIGEEL